MTAHALHPHTPQPPLRPRSLTDLVELVPYLLGFHPHDSLVLVALTGPNRRVGVTMRVDLAAARDCPELPGSLTCYLRREDASEAIALVYGGTDEAGDDPPRSLPHLPVAQALASGLADGGVTLVDALYVGRRRWWSYACTDPGCCPSEGRLVPGPDGRTSPAVAAATYAGMVALPSRQALEHTLEPSDQVPRAALAAATARASHDQGESAEESAGAAPGGGPNREVSGGARSRWRRRAVDELDRVVAEQMSTGHRRIPDEQAASLLVALRDDRVRDACCDWVTGERGEAALALWRQLATRAGPPYHIAPLALVAWTAWHTGSGPLARIAADRVLAAEPGHRLALLLTEALDRGVNPAAVRQPRRRRGPTRGTRGG